MFVLPYSASRFTDTCDYNSSERNIKYTFLVFCAKNLNGFPQMTRVNTLHHLLEWKHIEDFIL
jgi:hypothetical protein